MLVDTVFETSWTIVEYQKTENQSLEERKCQSLKDELSFSKSGLCEFLDGTHLSISTADMLT